MTTNVTRYEEKSESRFDFYVHFNEGRYTYRRYKDGRQDALRFGDEWRTADELSGDSLIAAMGRMIEDQQNQIHQLKHMNGLIERSSQAFSAHSKEGEEHFILVPFKLEDDHYSARDAEKIMRLMINSVETEMVDFGNPLAFKANGAPPDALSDALSDGETSQKRSLFTLSSNV